MFKNKVFKTILIFIVFGILVAGAIAFYIFNVPHRDVQATKTDYVFQSSEIVNEYLTDSEKANEKYLDEEGESKILEITGRITSISIDFNNQKVVLLKEDNDNAGVSCTFTINSKNSLKNLELGQMISVKGVIRSGASYDTDLEMYENVILEKCSLIKVINNKP